MNLKSVYKWTAGLCAGLSLVLAVNEIRQTDPFANLNPNSPAAPIVRDVFENGEQVDGKTKKKNYCFVPQLSGDDYMDAEIELDERGYPTGGLKVTTLGPAPMNRRLQDFPDLDGNGDCDGDDPELDKRYEKIVSGIKEDIKYRNMARAVFDYVEKNGNPMTVWEPYFPRISWLSFLGRNVRPPNYPAEVICGLEDADLQLKSKIQGLFGGPEISIGNLVVVNGKPTIDDAWLDVGLLGYANRDEKTRSYRTLLEKATQKLGIKVDE